jgi:flagellin-like protein
MWANRAKRWRRKNKRGVSPIIATILLVAITVVLAAVLYVLISGLVHGPGNTPISTALGVGGATLVSGTSAAAAVPFGSGAACAIIASPLVNYHYCYTVTITTASTGLTLGSLNFQITTVSGGAPTIAAGGIAMTSIAGTVIAYGTTADPYVNSAQPFTYSGVTATTQVATSMTIWLDMGNAASPAGLGDTLTVFGVDSYSGSVSVPLP